MRLERLRVGRKIPAARTFCKSEQEADMLKTLGSLEDKAIAADTR